MIKVPSINFYEICSVGGLVVPFGTEGQTWQSQQRCWQCMHLIIGKIIVKWVDTVAWYLGIVLWRNVLLLSSVLQVESAGSSGMLAPI